VAYAVSAAQLLFVPGWTGCALPVLAVVSAARRAGLLSDGTRIVAASPALPMSMPHTRSRYSGSSVTSSSWPSSLPLRGAASVRGGTARGTGGERKKLTRVLEATMNNPLVTGSRRQADRRPAPRPEEKRRHGRYRPPFFTPVRRPRRGYLGLTGNNLRSGGAGQLTAAAGSRGCRLSWCGGVSGPVWWWRGPGAVQAAVVMVTFMPGLSRSISRILLRVWRWGSSRS